MDTKIIAPSILAADFANLQKEVEMVNTSQAQWLHIDVMDGTFVPNISFGAPVIKAIKKHSKKPLDVHLMIVQPARYLDYFANLGAHVLTVHYEACTHLHRCLQNIRTLGIKAGVALNPHTPVSLLEPIINDIDVVCLMSVNPGFGGQRFIDYTYKKIAALKKIITQNDSGCLIEIDGGVNAENAPLLVEKGADILVAGSFVFNSENPLDTIGTLLKKVNS